MNDAKQERVIAAHDALVAAHRAYHDEYVKHVVWFGEGQMPERDLDPPTREDFETLAQLHEVEAAAREAYRDALGET